MSLNGNVRRKRSQLWFSHLEFCITLNASIQSILFVLFHNVNCVSDCVAKYFVCASRVTAWCGSRYAPVPNMRYLSNDSITRRLSWAMDSMYKLGPFHGFEVMNFWCSYSSNVCDGCDQRGVMIFRPTYGPIIP